MITSTVRWVRSGDDRLHVGTADGLRLGWYDLRTGVTQLLDPAPGAAAEVQACVDSYLVVVGARSVRAEGLPPGLRCACHDGSADKRSLTPCLSSTRVPQTRGEPAGQRRYSGR